MEDKLFGQWLDLVIYPLYPNISPTFEFSESGRVLKGPVLLKVDSGPGRISTAAENLIFREKALHLGLIILLGLPNSTAVTQEMDDIFGAFKTACRS
jgi:hypothetical protein